MLKKKKCGKGGDDKIKLKKGCQKGEKPAVRKEKRRIQNSSKECCYPGDGGCWEVPQFPTQLSLFWTCFSFRNVKPLTYVPIFSMESMVLLHRARGQIYGTHKPASWV